MLHWVYPAIAITRYTPVEKQHSSFFAQCTLYVHAHFKLCKYGYRTLRNLSKVFIASQQETL